MDTVCAASWTISPVSSRSLCYVFSYDIERPSVDGGACWMRGPHVLIKIKLVYAVKMSHKEIKTSMSRRENLNITANETPGRNRQKTGHKLR